MKANIFVSTLKFSLRIIVLHLYNKMLEKLKKLVQVEKKRYSEKGIVNTMIALFLFLGIIWVAVTLGRIFWPEHVENKFQFIFIGSIVCHTGFSIVSFLLHMPGYFGWSDYYARHLVNKKSTRPWERKNWPEQRAKTIKTLLINQFLVYPLAIYLSNMREVRVRFDNFPDFIEVLTQILVVYFI